MQRYISIFCACCLLTAPAYAANLTAQQIRTEIVGKTLSFTGKNSNGANVAGTNVYASDGKAKLTINGNPDEGTWRIKGSQMCATYKTIRQGKEGCFTFNKIGAAKYKTSHGLEVTAQ